MKTPREVLFGQHQVAEAKLDAIREKVVAGLDLDAPVLAKQMPLMMPRRASAPEAGWRQFWWSLRWHLAGLSAAWLVVIALSIDHTPAPARGVARQDASSPRQLLAALRENQRQLRELIEAPAAEPAREPQKPAPSPRSQVQPFSMTPV
jgi:chemotaxis response regulator CheB